MCVEKYPKVSNNFAKFIDTEMNVYSQGKLNEYCMKSLIIEYCINEKILTIIIILKILYDRD